MHDNLISKFLHAEVYLAQERKEILDQLRDPKREILLNLLENNVNSVRRLRSLKEDAIGSLARNVLDREADCAECDCGCGCGDEDGDEDYTLNLVQKPFSECPTEFGKFARTKECFTKCDVINECQEATESDRLALDDKAP